jgi:hypothetical protein
VQDQVERPRASQQTREALGAAGTGNDADAGLGQAVAEVAAAHETEVAGEAQLAAAACGIAVDGGDADGVHPLEAQAQRVEGVESRRRVRVRFRDGLATGLGLGAGRQLAHLVVGDEDTVCAPAEDQDPRWRRVPLDGVQQGVQLGDALGACRRRSRDLGA